MVNKICLSISPFYHYCFWFVGAKSISRMTLWGATPCPGLPTAPPHLTRRTAPSSTDWLLVPVTTLWECGSVQRTLRLAVAALLVPGAGRRNLAPALLLMRTGCVTWPSRPVLPSLTACSQAARRTRLCMCGGSRSTAGSLLCCGSSRRLSGESAGLSLATYLPSPLVTTRSVYGSSPWMRPGCRFLLWKKANKIFEKVYESIVSRTV